MTPSELVDLGFAVCEVAAPDPERGCTCRLHEQCPSPGKHPVGKGWLASAISKRERGYRVLPATLRLAPATSYGLVPMPGSGMIVIDRDDPTVLLPMPETFEVHRASADPRKGHYYGRLSDDIAESEVPRAFAGGEVRVAGSGHVVGPGCRHASGDTYDGNGADVGIFDREVIDALKALPPVRKDAWGKVEAVEGSRHAWLAGQARHLRGLGYDEDRIFAELQDLNIEFCVPPLTDREMDDVGRMAEWAVKNIKPDEAPTVTFRSTSRVSRHGVREARTGQRESS